MIGVLRGWKMKVVISLLTLCLLGNVRSDSEACSSSTRPRVMTTPSGSFTSPNYPNNYDNNANCQWRIDPPGDAPIILEFDDFGTESGYDVVEVYDGPSASSTRVLQASGSTVPSAITSTGGSLFVRFTSDSSVNEKGFSARYSRPDSACSGGEPRVIEVSIGESGDLTSPGHPEDYPPNLDCGWTLRTPSNGAIELEFSVFVVEEEDLPGCRWDYLEIFDPVDNSRDRHCGNDTPPARTSSGNELSVFFISDQSIQRIGFSAQYRGVSRGSVASTTPGTPGSTTATVVTGSTSTGPSGSSVTGGSTTDFTVTATATGTVPTTPTSPPNITFNPPPISVSLGGTFRSIGSGDLPPTCLSAYSEEIRKSLVRYIFSANDLIGDTLCANISDLFITDGETSAVGLGQEGFASIRVTQQTVEYRSWAEQAACAAEIAEHASNQGNWPNPIINPIPGCVNVVFTENVFSIDSRGYECPRV